MSATREWDRRGLLRTCGAAAAATAILNFRPAQAMATPAAAATPAAVRATLGAYADAVWPDTSARAMSAVLEMPALGIAGRLPDLAAVLNQQAASRRGFAGLPRNSRARIVAQLTADNRPDRLTWIGLAVLSGIAAQVDDYRAGRSAIAGDRA
jgi:hypothetical protein